ncbi:DNA-processing protein DprA [Vibrio mexicanus]|uniref:DNA-processing protein DprA n=1 Tax=Vibrio mexicanus TaxID=1004326 RepID=UPI00063C7B0E|nr:DNA-processing protein DprA [Vibrio mexicanus]
MTSHSLDAWLTLSFTPRLGAKSLSKLVSIDSADNIVNYDAKQLQALGLKPEQVRYIQTQAKRDVALCMEWQQSDPLNHIICLFDSEYPPLLKQAPSPPSVLFVRGDKSSLLEPQVALVGSRNASLEGLEHAHHFAKAFAQHGLVVTSGLALGVDGHAHNGALEGQGKTVAVLGSGLKQVYPARHRSLAERVVEQGALVSEFRPDAKPRPEHFPRRNRIISGLSAGVLVVEAAEKSGSLITARYALEQGREVFAIPGSINQVSSRGCNQLIKQGASLVQTAKDVLDEIEHLVDWSINNKPFVQSSLFESEQPTEELPFSNLLANVGVEVTPVDILASRTHIPVHEVMMQLLELELSGHVVAVSGGYIRKGRG